jgi:hypothetical protein
MVSHGRAGWSAADGSDMAAIAWHTPLCCRLSAALNVRSGGACSYYKPRMRYEMCYLRRDKARCEPPPPHTRAPLMHFVRSRGGCGVLVGMFRRIVAICLVDEPVQPGVFYLLGPRRHVSAGVDQGCRDVIDHHADSSALLLTTGQVAPLRILPLFIAWGQATVDGVISANSVERAQSTG